MKRKKNAVTLLELILAITFLSVIVLGINSIYYFSHFHAVNTERKAAVQNQLTVLKEHLRREISKAIGNEVIYGAGTVIATEKISSDNAIEIYVDSGASSGTGADIIYAAGDGNPFTSTDHFIAYRFTDANGKKADQYQIWFCPECLNPNPTQCSSCIIKWGDNIVARKIVTFQLNPPKSTTTVLTDNSITFQIKTCWDPADSAITGLDNGTVDNPCITTTNTLITMPSVTAH